MKQYKIIKGIKLFFQIMYLNLKIFLGNLKLFLRSRSRLLWNKLYIRKDEFHTFLDIDLEALLTMNSKQQERYQLDLIRRRNIAHKKDIEGKEDIKLRKELLILLNKEARRKATTVVDKFSKEKGAICTRFMIPKSINMFSKMDYALVVFIDNLQIDFVYSGFIFPRWKNSW